MAEKKRKIVQCPFCDSNRLYFRRGLVSDVLISLLVPVRSYTCGSCSRSFRRFGNYFTSKQAMIHIFGILAMLAFIDPQVLNPQNWLLEKEKTENLAEIQVKTETNQTVQNPVEEDLPLLSMAIANATNSTFVVNNGTLTLAANATVNDLEPVQNASVENATEETILSFNSTATASIPDSNATVEQTNPEDETKQGLQEGRLNSIYFKNIDGKTRINLDLGGSPLSYTSFFLREPDRLVVDIHGGWEYYGPATLKPENPVFSKFRIGIYEDKIRMVMDLKGTTPTPEITKTDSGLNIDVK